MYSVPEFAIIISVKGTKMITEEAARDFQLGFIEGMITEAAENGGTTIRVTDPFWVVDGRVQNKIFDILRNAGYVVKFNHMQGDGPVQIVNISW